MILRVFFFFFGGIYELLPNTQSKPGLARNGRVVWIGQLFASTACTCLT